MHYKGNDSYKFALYHLYALKITDFWKNTKKDCIFS